MENMDEKTGKGWKILLIVLLIIAIAAAAAVPAYLVGRDSGDDDKDNGNGTTITKPEAAPAEDITPLVPGGDGMVEPLDTGGGEPPAETPAEVPADTTDTTTERYVVGEGGGSTPCIDGFRTTTTITYWSDGTTDTVTVTEPCS